MASLKDNPSDDKGSRVTNSNVPFFGVATGVGTFDTAAGVETLGVATGVAVFETAWGVGALDGTREVAEAA